MSTSLKARAARKAVKTTAKHSAHGTLSKLKRSPARSSALLALGCAFGFAVGRLTAASAA